ncbi:MAG TPA: hypothetical protein VN081_01640 [Dongiaceae bacterium]|nr:hypothetical protein [Dongiaceae bacterium]
MSIENAFAVISIAVVIYLILTVITAIIVSDAINNSGNWYETLPWAERVDTGLVVFAEIMMILRARGTMKGIIATFLIILWPLYFAVTILLFLVRLFGYWIPEVFSDAGQDIKSYSRE